TGPPAAGAAAAPAPPPHTHLLRHDKVADVPRYIQLIRGQRARLETVVNGGDRDQVVAACRAAVISWNQLGNVWPQDDGRWPEALDRLVPDGTPHDQRLLLEDLTPEPVPDEVDNASEPATLFAVEQLSAGQLTEPGRPGQVARSPRAAFSAPTTT